MNVNHIIVVIPYYKNELTTYEKFSLNRALKVLSRYPIVFISPEELSISPEYQHINVQRFDNEYFQALRGYNRLLLSDNFYKRFLDYKYILIYQLDALVFNDEIDYWISLNYDYYGAPWNKTWKKRYYNFYGLVKRKVGNGGFSLRKTAVFYKMTKRIRRIAKYIRFGEDIFWCNYGNLVYPNLKIIDQDLAVRFAFESEPEKLFSRNGNKLPFGCHAYEKNDLSFWRKMILDLPY
ncbi:MAG: DUF5672 family protein [Bacteroidota bacterium]